MHLGVEKSLSEVIKADALKWIKKSKEMDFSKTIIFFDPPYQMENLYEEFISLVLAKRSWRNLDRAWTKRKVLPENNEST